MEYILSLSYGKDSLACLGAIEQLSWPLDRIEWRAPFGYDGLYLVSNTGMVYSVRRRAIVYKPAGLLEGIQLTREPVPIFIRLRRMPLLR